MARPMGKSLTLREAAAYLGCAAQTLRNQWRKYPWLVDGATKGGGMPLTFTIASLEAHKRAHRISASPAPRAVSA